MEVGMHEAKTRLSELVKQVRAGKQVRLTSRGHVVAELTLPASERRVRAKQQIARLRKLIKQHPLGSYDEVMAWRREGAE